MDLIDAEAVEEIRQSGLFDADWYREEYLDVKMLGMDPVEHFLWIGERLNRKPSPDFDPTAYREANPGVAREGVSLFLHYIRSKSATKLSRVELYERTSTKSSVSIKQPSPQTGASSRVVSRLKEVVSRDRNRTRLSDLPKMKRKIYEALQPHFDVGYYLYKNRDLAQARIDPILHYIDNGWREGRNPSASFDSAFYLKTYPDVAKLDLNPFYHYLTIGRQEGRRCRPFGAGDPTFDGLARVLGRTPADVEADLLKRQRHLSERLESGVLGEMVEKASELEPLVHHTISAALEAKFLPFHSQSVARQVLAMRQLHDAAGFARAKAVVIIPHCRLSGAAKVAAHLTLALSEIYGAGQVVVVRTDLDVMQFPEWFPEGCRHINFAQICENLPISEKQRVLVELIRTLRPACAFNVNSRVFYDALTPYGKALSQSVDIYTYMFCNDKNVYGAWEGYPVRRFYRLFDTLAGVITDSKFLEDKLRKQFLIPKAWDRKIVTIETPVAYAVQPAEAPSETERPQIFWAGRFDFQKRLDIVYRIAEAMPECDFRVWGEAVLDSRYAKLKPPANVVLEGVYETFAELPLDQCAVWLYTSEWDGVPTILIDVATAGIPLVGTCVGGTGEILQPDLSHPIKEVEDVAAYVSAIRSILSDRTQAVQNALALRERILSRRTPQRYLTSLKSVLNSEQTQ